MKKILTSMIAFAALAVSVIGCSTAIDNDPEELAKSKVVEKSMIVQGVSVTGFSKDLNGKKIALIKQTVVKTSDRKDGSDRSVESTMGTGTIADSAKLYKSGTAYIPFFGKDDTLVSNYSYKDFEVPKSVQDKIDANNATKEKKEDGSIKDEEVVSAVEVRFYLAIGDDLTSPKNKVLIEKTSSTGSMTYEGAQLDVITSKFGTKTADLEKRWLKVIVPEETASNIVGTFEFEKAAKIEEPLTSLDGYAVQAWRTTLWTACNTKLTTVSKSEWKWEVKTGTDDYSSYKFSIIPAIDTWTDRWELDEKYTLVVGATEVGPMNHNDEPTRATIDLEANSTYTFTLLLKSDGVYVKVTKS